MDEMKQVACIDGIEVWSDKGGKITVENEIVKFEDGSACDTKKYQIANVGKGRIEIRSTKTPAEIIVGPRSFRASELTIRDITAHIDIEPHEKDVIEVTISGKTTDCDTVKISEASGKLFMDRENNPMHTFKKTEPEKKQSDKKEKHGLIKSIKDFLATPISLPKISIEIATLSRPSVKIKVPKNIPITITNTDGELHVGNTEGDVHLDLDTMFEANLGKVANTSISSSGDGDINVSEINGTLAATLNGYGDVNVESGIVSDLKIEANNGGNFEFKGMASSANLEINDDGSISIGRIVGNLITSLNGYGDLEIESGEITDLKININDDGDFRFGGTAINAELTSSSDGEITIHKVEGDLTAVIDDCADGDISIEQGNIDNLTVNVNGNGDFEFEGTAKNSDLAIGEDANGNIYVETSKNRPYKDNDGYGDIIVGNWQKR